ncbi:hypothetical protein ACOSQ4_025046 [Xanthoceras sorbifolium]
MEGEIDKETKRKIKKTVKKILKGCSLNTMTEKSVREKASAELHLDFDEASYKRVVRKCVEEFLVKAKAESEEKRAQLQLQTPTTT